MDRLACRERHFEAEVLDPNRLVSSAAELGYDISPDLVVDRLEIESLRIEVATEFAVDSHEKVSVEARRDAAGIVVGAFEHFAVFAEIDSE